MNKYKTNIYSSLFFMAFGLIVWIMIPYCIREASMYSMGIEFLNSHFMPRFLVIMLQVCSICNIVINLIQYRIIKKNQGVVDTYKIPVWKDERRVLMFASIILLFALMLKYAGFIISSAVSSGLLLLFLKDKKVWHYVTTLAFIIGIYLVFTNMLYVQLP